MNIQRYEGEHRTPKLSFTIKRLDRSEKADLTRLRVDRPCSRVYYSSSRHPASPITEGPQADAYWQARVSVCVVKSAC
jgi:hypothetical protein